MGFPGNISEKALVKSGRCCCICHKFCGFKIELHHIRQISEGGNNTFDNCIPLCFDCHADVKAYNSNHPKGRKYTENELKSHKNNWYKKNNKTYGIIDHDNYVLLDVESFHKITNILQSDRIMYFLKVHDFASSFDRNVLNPLRQYIFECDMPDLEFIDADIESLRIKLYNEINELLKLISFKTFPYSKGCNRIPPEGKIKTPQIYKETVENINRIASNITNTHCDFIKLGRRKYGNYLINPQFV